MIKWPSGTCRWPMTRIMMLLLLSTPFIYAAISPGRGVGPLPQTPPAKVTKAWTPPSPSVNATIPVVQNFNATRPVSATGLGVRNIAQRSQNSTLNSNRQLKNITSTQKSTLTRSSRSARQRMSKLSYSQNIAMNMIYKQLKEVLEEDRRMGRDGQEAKLAREWMKAFPESPFNVELQRKLDAMHRVRKAQLNIKLYLLMELRKCILNASRRIHVKEDLATKETRLRKEYKALMQQFVTFFHRIHRQSNQKMELRIKQALKKMSSESSRMDVNTIMRQYGQYGSNISHSNSDNRSRVSNISRRSDIRNVRNSDSRSMNSNNVHSRSSNISKRSSVANHIKNSNLKNVENRSNISSSKSSVKNISSKKSSVKNISSKRSSVKDISSKKSSVKDVKSKRTSVEAVRISKLETSMAKQLEKIQKEIKRARSSKVCGCGGCGGCGCCGGNKQSDKPESPEKDERNGEEKENEEKEKEEKNEESENEEDLKKTKHEKEKEESASESESPKKKCKTVIKTCCEEEKTPGDSKNEKGGAEKDSKKPSAKNPAKKTSVKKPASSSKSPSTKRRPLTSAQLARIAAAIKSPPCTACQQGIE